MTRVERKPKFVCAKPKDDTISGFTKVPRLAHAFLCTRDVLVIWAFSKPANINNKIKYLE